MRVAQSFALLLILAYGNAYRATVIGLLNFDALPDTLTYGDPDATGTAKIEIALATADGKSERTVRRYAPVSGPHIVVSSKRLAEITILESGDTASSTKYFRTFTYNQHMKDWFLTKEIRLQKRMSGDSYAPPRIEIAYRNGQQGLGGAKIGEADALTESAEARSSRLLKELMALHDTLMGLYKEHRLATISESAYDVTGLAEMIYCVPVTQGTAETYNNIGFFLAEKNEAVYSAIYVLDQVIQAVPDRAVAYLNAGDAYFRVQSLSNAKAAYAKYVDLMTKQGMAKKIPKRALDRAADGRK